MPAPKDDPLVQFGLDAIDLRWTLKDIASNRKWLINRDHLPKLTELGLVEMRDGTPHLTAAGETATWERRSRCSVFPEATTACSRFAFRAPRD